MSALESSQQFYEEQLKQRVIEHPYPMLAAAVGVGYVLGGGLFTTATARVLGIGLRLAQVPYLREQLLGAAERAADIVLPVAHVGANGGGR